MVRKELMIQQALLFLKTYHSVYIEKQASGL
jgi:hypothetical protein